MSNKKQIILDPYFDSLLIKSFEQIQDSQVYIFREKNKLQELSRSVSVKAKDLIDNNFLNPPTSNQYKQIVNISRPKDILVEKEPLREKIRFVFTRKIF